MQSSIQVGLQSLPMPLQDLLSAAAVEAEYRNWPLYLVGGAVRDLLRRQAEKTVALCELDFVVDANHAESIQGAAELADALHKHYPKAHLQIYGRFQTATMIWRSHPQFGNFSIDIATARTESYPYPAADPDVVVGSIQQDLSRRDFTINTLAVCLTTHQSLDSTPELIDFFGGLADLQHQKIRVLHPNSFVEDPTRIFRAVRFATRFGFVIEPQTEGYIRDAIASGIYQQTQTQNHSVPALQSRLKKELKAILKLPDWETALALLSELAALKCLHPQLNIDQEWWKQTQLALNWLALFDPKTQEIQPWQLTLELLIAQLGSEDRAKVSMNLCLGVRSHQRLSTLAPVARDIHSGLKHHLPSQIFQCLQRYDLPILLLVAARSSCTIRQSIWRYLQEWKMVKPVLDGNDLIRLGYQPGRDFKSMLLKVLYATLDGVIRTTDEAENLVLQNFPLQDEPPEN